MKILITGASGFIGRSILKLLFKTTHDIGVIVRDSSYDLKNHNVIYGDLNAFNLISEKVIQFQPDIIIYLSWEGIPDFSKSVSQNNLFIALNFFDKVIKNTKCKKIIVSGSCFEYGKKLGPCKETDSVNIDSYFTWAKHSLYQYLDIQCQQKHINLNWFRFFYVYGPNQRQNSLIPTLIKSISSLEIPQIKTPLNKNDFIYVNDIANLIVKAVDIHMASGIYNAGSGTASSVYDICRIVENQLLETDSITKQILTNGEKTSTVNFWADMNKTNNIIKKTSTTSLKNGIKHQVKSMEHNLLK